MESANKFMVIYIKKFNDRFSVVPKGEPVFRKLDKNTNIDYVLCSKIPRKLDRGSAFSYKNNYYQLVSGGKPARSNGFRYDLRDEKLHEGLFNSTIVWETE